MPFTHLNNEEFCNHFDKHSLSVDEVAKLRDLTFNPFSLSNRGRSYLTINSDLDPDHNYFNTIINYMDACDYHDEGSFKQMIKSSTNTDFSILHLNIRSIMNKFDDFKAYLDSLDHEFSVIGLSETSKNYFLALM